MSANKRVAVQIQLDHKTANTVSAAAAALGKTEGEVMTDALAQFANKHAPEQLTTSDLLFRCFSQVVDALPMIAQALDAETGVAHIVIPTINATVHGVINHDTMVAIIKSSIDGGTFTGGIECHLDATDVVMSEIQTGDALLLLKYQPVRVIRG